MAEEEDDEYDDDEDEFEKFEADDIPKAPSPKSGNQKEEDDEYDDDVDEFEESPANSPKHAEDSLQQKTFNKGPTFEAESEEENFDEDFELDEGSETESPKAAKQEEKASKSHQRQKEEAEGTKKAAELQAKEEEEREAQRRNVEEARLAAEAEAEAAKKAAELQTKEEEERETQRRNEEEARLAAEAEAEAAKKAAELQAKEEEERETQRRNEEEARLAAEAEAAKKAAELQAKEEEERETQRRNEEEARLAAEAEAEAAKKAAELQATEEEERETQRRKEEEARLVAEAEAEVAKKAAELQAKEEEESEEQRREEEAKLVAESETKKADVPERCEDEARSSLEPRFAVEPESLFAKAQPTALSFNEDAPPEDGEHIQADVEVEEPQPVEIQDENGNWQRRSLNEGEEGEAEDEDDDPVQEQHTDVLAMLQRSSSMPAFGGALAVARRRIPSHLRAPKRKAQRKLPPPAQIQSWDTRHQLSGTENELLPKRLRVYFSRPQSLPELKEDLGARKHMTSARRRLSEMEIPPTKPTPLSADSGPPAIPHKHEFGGSMKDRDNVPRPWNNRWSEGIGTLNDGMHPSHRQYFSKDSLFAEAPSQRWRRYQDVEVTRDYSHGTARWKPNIDKEGRPPRFPPIGF